jgi:hypothetical protein
MAATPAQSKLSIDSARVEPSAPLTNDDGSIGRWFGSRSSLMVLSSIILVLVAISIFYFADQDGKRLLLRWRILSPMADAMMVVSVTVLLTELGPFRSYVEERLQALKQVLDRPMFDRLTDASYLRDNFTPELLLAVRKASTCASLPANIKDYPLFLSIIEDSVLPLAAKAVWRKDLHLSLRHEIQQNREQTLLRQKSTLSSTYVNAGSAEEHITVPVRREYKKLDGIADDQLCCNGWAKVQAEGAAEPLITKLQFQLTDLGDSVLFEAEIDVKVGDRAVLVATGYDALMEPNDALRLSLTIPTTGLRVTYQHPVEIKPELYCFNVGGELRTIANDDTFHQWEHSGIFLPHHGIVLAHPVTRRKGERRPPQKAA